MFNHIAPKYDFLNHFLSLGIDKSWRKKVVKELKKKDPKRMLDVASGTGDLAIAAAMRMPNLKVEATDIAAVMLEKAQIKIEKRKLSDRINVSIADAENLQFDATQFDAVTAAFGVRNFEDVPKGLSEMYRVLKPGGKLIILEFSKPRKGPFAMFFRFYFKFILPFLGRLFSGNNRAYTYLPESVEAFAERENFIQLMEQAGFQSCDYKVLTFGVACMYQGIK
ncbi:MAG: bifunctional demethylmenaquinone methyltransferase/2-methoxy-6-polyprenyl-1,4-benzoquinol methylase UbiE [Salinivirgaceae bacterium]|nr:MAG: bifunctional demethylmenaquinone methyltransferase/2-methoxy-6-polyprenyl-1,4-benzoquinol methylase UbiE [Salinivirgaceae bacterium]